MVIDWQWTPNQQTSEALIDLAQRAIASSPQRAANWANLANLLVLLRGQRAALDVLVQGISRCPEDAQLRFMAARAHYALGEYEKGLEECERVLAAAPEYEPAQLLRSSLLVKTTGLKAAKPLLDAPVAGAASQSYVFEYLAAHLSEPGVAAALIERCNRALAENPPSVQAVYFKALALAHSGEPAAARALLSLDDVVELSTPDAPIGHDGQEGFRAALVDEIMSHPSLRPNPPGKSTLGGRQTDPLREEDGPTLAALFGIIRKGIECYARKLHQVDGAKPAKCSLQVWAVVLEPQGRQETHRHPDGWLSGVYYVQAPQSKDTGRYCGDLLVGIEDSGIRVPWEIRRIEPVPGRMVIFPSYVPHATEPSNAPGERISIGFDAIRLD